MITYRTLAYDGRRRDLLVRHQRLAHPELEPGAGVDGLPPRRRKTSDTTSDTTTTDAHTTAKLVEGEDNSSIRSREVDERDRQAVDMLISPQGQGWQLEQQQLPEPIQQDTVRSSNPDTQSGSSLPQIDTINVQHEVAAIQPLLVEQPQVLLTNPTFDLGESPDLDIFWNDTQDFYPSLPNDFFDTDFSITDITQRLAVNRREEEPPAAVAAAATGHDRQPSPVASRFPSLEPTDLGTDDLRGGTTHPVSQTMKVTGMMSQASPWRISAEMHRRIIDVCVPFHSIWASTFSIPSRHTLSRYLEGYFRGFHEHLPFLHPPTFSAATASPELIIALAAVGALYRFEHAKGYELYKAADAMVEWRLRQAKSDVLTRLSGCSPSYAGLSVSPQDRPNSDPSPGQPYINASTLPSDRDNSQLNLLQAMIVLMAISSWGDRSMVPESLSMSSQVSVLAQSLGLGQVESAEPEAQVGTWHDWTALEGRRRTLFVAYILTNLQSVAFNVPPAILNQDIGLILPGCSSDWNVTSAREWAQRRQQHHQYKLRSFRDTLDSLLQGVPPSHIEALSAFGNYVLMHGILQQIFLARQTVIQPTASLPIEFIKRMEDALRAWQESWEATHESTLDPSSPKGPLGFNSTALLRLAHIRLNANVGPRRQLMMRDPRVIAAAFVDTHINIDSVQDKSVHLDRAVLQCIHAFSIPVRVGIAYVARTQTLNWSIQHALCNLECALLLVRWLRAIADMVANRGFDSLYADQVKLLNMTFTLVRETNLGEERPGNDLGYDQARRIRRLAASVASLWAETFEGFHVFEMVYVIGAAMSTVARTLESALDEESRW